MNMFKKGILADYKFNMNQLWMWLPKKTNTFPGP